MKILLRRPDGKKWQKLEPFIYDKEDQLEALLEEPPDLLPTSDGKPVLFFKRQVSLGPNAVDLLGVDADGNIVVVECKLAANREVRRMVVGQILEYAAQLWGMDFKEFAKLLTNDSASLAELVMQRVGEDDWSKESFLTNIQRSLTEGSFRLVIAVNGINDELKGILEYLNERGVHLEALELRQFKDANNNEILVPEIYGRSVHKDKGHTDLQNLQYEFWKGFADFCKEKGTFLAIPNPQYGSFVTIAVGRANTHITLTVRAAEKPIGCQLTVLGNPQSIGLFRQLQDQKIQIESELGTAMEWDPPTKEGEQGKIIIFQPANLSLRNRWPEYFVWLKETAEKFYRGFSPRVKALK